MWYLEVFRRCVVFFYLFVAFRKQKKEFPFDMVISSEPLLYTADMELPVVISLPK